MKDDVKRLKQFFLLFRSHWLSYGVSSAMVSCRNLLITWLSAFISSRVLAVVLEGGSLDLLRELGLFSALLLGFLAFDAVGLYAQAVSIQKISNTLRRQLYRSILSAPMPETARLGQRGELIARVNRDVGTASGLLSSGLVLPLMFLISGIGATIIIGRESLLICAGLYVLGLAALFIQTKLAKTMRTSFSAMEKDTTEGLSLYMQSLSQSADIRMAGLSRPVSAAFRDIMRSYRKHGRKYGLFQGASGGFDQVVQYASFFGVIAASLYLYSTGAMTLPAVVLVSQMASSILTMILTISSSITNVHTSLVGIDRLFEVLDLPPEDTAGALFRLPAAGGEEPLVRAENAACRFADGSSPFTGLNLVIPANRIVALKGESGCGKTTLMRLLLKFQPYTGGSLRLLGQEVRGCSAVSLRQAIGYVPQENVIFSGTVRENLFIGQTENRAGDGEIRQVLEGIGADSWVFALEKGLDTPLAEGGGSLSGGQRQMLAIARAILSRRRILILDEAFAGVDKEHIGQIVRYIRQLPDAPSVLIITHDGQVAAACDQQVAIGPAV